MKSLAIALALSLPLFTTGCGDGEKPNETVTGPMTVSYAIQLTEKSRATHSDNYGKIQFFDHYIVLISEDGKGGQVLPLDKLYSLTWRMRD